MGLENGLDVVVFVAPRRVISSAANHPAATHSPQCGEWGRQCRK